MVVNIFFYLVPVHHPNIVWRRPWVSVVRYKWVQEKELPTSLFVDLINCRTKLQQEFGLVHVETTLCSEMRYELLEKGSVLSG